MIEQITWDEILPIWTNDLWPGRESAIEPFSVMMYLGGMDMSIIKNADPVFFGYKENGKLIGVNSGHLTSEYTFRSRGVFVYPEHRGKGIAKQLLQATIDYARDETSAILIWSIPKKSALPTYEKVGFTRIGPWLDEGMEFGPNRYVYKQIKER